MFVLSNIDDDKEKFILVPNKLVYTIGRLSTDLILKADLSISRTHVRLHLPSAKTGGELTVEDLGSKYGTFINKGIESNTKMLAKMPTPLQVGDKLRVGALKSIWQLSQLKLVTTASSLAELEIKELDQLIRPLGGTVLPSWTDQCSHLTMENVSVTVKLLHALLENKPIVKVAFWRELLKVARTVHATAGLPQPENYAPAQPADMPSIKWRSQRTKLFAGKTFVFMNRRNFELYAPVVQKAGGACKDLNSGVRKAFLIKSDVVVIQYVHSGQTQSSETIFSVEAILEQAGLRLIPDYEIGLAILHCSTQKFCNPSHKMMEYSLPTTESMDSSILVSNTETEQRQTEQCSNKASEFVVPESEKSEKSEKSEIYAPSIESERLETDPKPAAPKSTLLTIQRKRNNNAIYLDSSDEEVEAVKAKISKTSIEIKPKQKRKAAIIVDSSDEESQAQNQSRKKTKTVDKPKSNQAVDSSLEEKENPEEAYFVDIDNLLNKKPKSLQQKQAAAELNKRSTHSNDLQQREMETKSPTPSRRSPRGKQTAEKVKSKVLQNDEDSEDEELFQFKSKAPAAAAAKRAPFKSPEVNIQSEQQSTYKAMPSSKVQQTAKISVRNFLEKSQNHNANQTVAAAATQPRKRLRLEQLNESDSDDNENLFAFGASKKSKQTIGSDNDSNDGHMFNFKSATQQEHNNIDSDNDQDSVDTEPFIPNNKTKSKYIVPKPKLMPLKINVSGWLTCSGLHEDIKQELKPDPNDDVINNDAEAKQSTIKMEAEDDDDEKLAHLKWLAAIKDSIKVRMCDLSISGRHQDETDAADATASKYIGRKNFKKFVKKRNLHPQQHVLELKRMQLAEGIVSEL